MVLDNGMEYWRMVDGGHFTARGRVESSKSGRGIIIKSGAVVRVVRDAHQRVTTIIGGTGHFRLERVRDESTFRHVFAELTNVIADDDSEVRVIVAELKRITGYDITAARVIARALHMKHKPNGDTARAVCRKLDKLNDAAGDDEGDDDTFEDGIVALLGGAS